MVLFYRNSADILIFAQDTPFYIRIGMPTLGGLVVGLAVYFGAREAKRGTAFRKLWKPLC